MDIHTSQPRRSFRLPRLRSLRARGWPTWLKLSLAAVVLLGALGATAGASFYVGARTERRTGLTEKIDRVLYQDISPIRVVRNYIGSFGAAPERIVIDIKHKHFAKLARWREQALERGQITSDLKKQVPAKIRYGDQVLDVKLRLKGEWTSHVDTDKWSFRVRMKQGNLFGMRRFSLQHPKARHYSHEWLYLKALAREDIVSLRYEFVAVTVNGKNLGVYAMEESPAEQLIEHYRRREGLIIRLNEDLNFEPFANVPGRPKGYALAGGVTGQHSADIVSFSTKQIAANPEMRRQFLVAHNLLQGLRTGALSTRQVFDMEKLALYFAISDLTGSVTTSADWSDMAFLYDPVTSRLEPIGKEGVSLFMPIGQRRGGEAGFDYVTGAEFANQKWASTTALHARIFSDPEFFERYVAALERVSSPEYIDALLEDLGPELREQERILHGEWPFWYFDRKRLDKNAEAIRAVLAPTKGLHAYLQHDGQGPLRVDVGVIQLMPVEVLGLSTANAHFVPERPTILPGKARDDAPRLETVRFVPASGSLPSESAAEDLTLHYRLLGASAEQAAPVYPWQYLDLQRLADDLLRREPNVHELPFVSIDERTRTIAFRPGSWQIQRSIVVPPGYRLVAEAGVELDLVDSARLVSYSPLRFIGSETKPVRMHSSDQTGGGLAVLRAGEQSILDRVVFDGMSAPSEPDWTLTGAITFYDSPVEIRNCEFKNNRSEDSLNVIRSDFSVAGSVFWGSPSDAVDIDFSSGKIGTSSFSNIEGDAVDFSGSRIELEELRIDNVADKGISIGEATHLTGRNIQIDRTRVGIAVKDYSDATLSDVEVSNAQIGLAAYVKKREFGPSRVKLDRFALDRVARRYIVERKSVVSVGGQSIPDDETNALALVDGAG